MSTRQCDRLLLLAGRIGFLSGRENGKPESQQSPFLNYSEKGYLVESL